MIKLTMGLTMPLLAIYFCCSYFTDHLTTHLCVWRSPECPWCRSVECGDTEVSLVKTIRLHLAGVTPWMEKHPTLKVEMITWS